MTYKKPLGVCNPGNFSNPCLGVLCSYMSKAEFKETKKCTHMTTLCHLPKRKKKDTACFVSIDALPKEGNGYPIRDFASHWGKEQRFLLR